MVMVAATLIFALTFLIVLFIFSPGAEAALIQGRLTVLKGAGTAAAVLEPDEDVSFRDRILTPFVSGFGQSILKMTPKRQLDEIKAKLARAGDPTTPSTFLVIRLTLAGTAVFPLLLGGRGFLIALCLGILGYRMPDFWLSRAIKGRQKAFSRLLPDALDLLSVSVEAGLGFDGALQRVAERAKAPMSVELTHTLSEIRLGRSRSEALKDLSDRMDIAELRQFVSAVIQAEALGVGLAKPLRTQADSLRVKRRQRAEEMAMKTPIKLLFPLVFLIFPALFVVLLGPAVLQFMKVLHP